MKTFNGLLLDIGPSVPTEFRLFAPGSNATMKGAIVMNEQAGRNILAAMAEHGSTQLPIDYDHGQVSGGYAGAGVAAGWFVPEVRSDSSLWATDVKWTPRALAALSAREYRFFSPAVYLNEKREIARLVNIALTNLPATRNQLPLVASAIGAPSADDVLAATVAALSADDLHVIALLGVSPVDYARQLLADAAARVAAIA